jgi:two-component system OmpR family sensor kinase
LSLRARLLLALLLLVTIGLSVTAVVTYEEQRSFLYRRVDQQVVATQPLVSAALGLADSRLPSPRRVVPPPNGGQRTPRRALSTFQTSGTYGALLSADHKILKTRLFTYGEAAPSRPVLPRNLSLSRDLSQIRLVTVASEAGSSLRYRMAAFAVSGGRIMVVAVPLREVDQTLHRLVAVEGLVGGGVIISLLVLGWVVIWLGLRPLERIGRVASQIAHGDLSRRVTPSSQRTEIGRLGLALNEMLVQIEQAFQDRADSENSLRRFLADASHELRTPLASIRGYAELFRLGAAADPASVRRSMTRIEAEATVLTRCRRSVALRSTSLSSPDMPPPTPKRSPRLARCCFTATGPCSWLPIPIS